MTDFLNSIRKVDCYCWKYLPIAHILFCDIWSLNGFFFV